MTRQSMLPVRELHATDLAVEDVVRLADDGSPKTGSTETGSRWCVSLYLPTHIAGRDVVQDPIRFRNLIAGAMSEFAGNPPASLAAARALADDPAFWAHGSTGLAVLIDDHTMTAIRLADPVAELAVVSDRYHLKPLLAAVSQNLTFDVLALSQHAVRLVRGSRSGGAEIEVPGMPASIADALYWDDRERQLQSHAAGRVGRGRVTPAFHGQDTGNASRTGDLRRFLQAVDHAVAELRNDSPAPLVLAGVDELVAEYRAITRCRHVVDGGVFGNSDHRPAGELTTRAWSLVEPLTTRHEHEAREAFLAGGAAALDSVEQAVVAAAAGHVASIFVPADEAMWGRYTPGKRVLVEHDNRHPLDHDLYDVAAIETVRHGGRAFAVPAAEVPGNGTAAALLRYA